MSEMKHTPGPWRVENDGETSVIIGRPTWKCRRHDEIGEWEVATIDDLLYDHPQESEANARLIAAAPDLLAMLKVAQLWLDVDGRYDMRGINATIAKAEGPTP